MSKETWGIVLALALGLVTFGLYLMDKAGKNTPAITIGVLLVNRGAYLGSALLDSVGMDTTIRGKIAWRICLITAVGLLAVGRFGIWVWPQTFEKEGKTPDGLQPTPPPVIIPSAKEIAEELAKRTRKNSPLICRISHCLAEISYYPKSWPRDSRCAS